MPTTTKGLPYPASTAPPNVPADLQALAQDLDFTKIPVLNAAQIPSASSLLSLYPMGLSLITMTTAEASAGGWPGAGSCHVLTIKPTTTRGAQFLFRNTTSPVAAFYRQLAADPGPHSPWAGGSGPYAQACGSTQLDAVTNPTATKQVNFPAGRFSQIPRVVASSATPSVFTGVASTTATSVSFIGRNITTYTSTYFVYWQAMQQLDTATDGSPLPTVLAPDTTGSGLLSTCHTPGCPNNGIPIELATWTDETTGELVHADQVECGVCGLPVTDIT